MRKTFGLIASLIFTFAAEAQQSRELLQSVGEAQAVRLEEYNSVFLKRQTYFASRYRIVKADTNLLMQERDITVTPFEDAEPFRIIWLRTRRSGEDMIVWTGLPDDPAYEDLGESVAVKIRMHAWDLDRSGNALISAQNRFEFSPLWSFDENDRPVLEGAGDPSSSNGTLATTPPPQTRDQIERHKRLKELDKHAFFSVTAVFEFWNGSKYVLEPLRYTPMYSVIYEIPGSTVIPFTVDPSSADITATAEQRTERRAIMERYQAAMDSLPLEDDKEIKGDIE